MPKNKRNQETCTIPVSRSLSTLKLTLPAGKKWEALPGHLQQELLHSLTCFSCEDTKRLGSEVKGRVSKGSLQFHGKCNRCGAEAVRVVENK